MIIETKEGEIKDKIVGVTIKLKIEVTRDTIDMTDQIKIIDIEMIDQANIMTEIIAYLTFQKYNATLKGIDQAHRSHLINLASLNRRIKFRKKNLALSHLVF